MRIFDFPSLPTASGCCCNLSSIAIMVVHPRIKATFACLGISPSFHHLLPIVSFCFLPLCHTIVDLFVKLASSRYCCQRLAASWRSPPGTWVVASSQLVPPTAANGWPPCRIASEADHCVPILLVSRLATPECSTCPSGVGAMRGTRESRQASWEPNGGQDY